MQDNNCLDQSGQRHEGLWRNGSASDSRSEGWELESLWPHLRTAVMDDRDRHSARDMLYVLAALVAASLARAHQRGTRAPQVAASRAPAALGRQASAKTAETPLSLFLSHSQPPGAQSAHSVFSSSPSSQERGVSAGYGNRRLQKQQRPHSAFS